MTVLATASLDTGRSGAYWALSDSLTMIRRTTRELDALLLSVMLPVMLMLLLFVYVFGGAIQTGTEYINYVVPGIILLCAGYGAANTAVAVANDMTNGIVDRFRTMPILSSAVLIGHVVASLARNVVSTALVLGVAYALGFRPTADPPDWRPSGSSRCSCWRCPGWPRSSDCSPAASRRPAGSPSSCCSCPM